jgi:hypothetical protein
MNIAAQSGKFSQTKSVISAPNPQVPSAAERVNSAMALCVLLKVIVQLPYVPKPCGPLPGRVTEVLVSSRAAVRLG